MNCDRVFDVLTRGPFPTGHCSDVDVEVHLARCASCRRLAEALRPAVELFRESVPADESRDLPGYWADWSVDPSTRPLSATETVPLAVAPPAQVEANSTQPVGVLMRHSWQLAAVFSGCLFVAVLHQVLSPWRTSPESGPAAAGQIALPTSPEMTLAADGATPERRDASRMLDALGLAPACFGPGKLLARADRAGVDCCTRCHATGGDVPRAATGAVAQSCSICHLQ